MNHLKYKKIANPFNIGSCARGEGFFNREEIQKEINFFLHTKAEHHFLIHGQRRIGKTSLLRYIQDTTGPSVYPVYYDLQDNARTPLKKLLKKIAEQIAIDINKPLNITDEEIEAEKFYSIMKKCKAIW